MQRQKVASSNIESVGYDKEKKILCVEFKGGSVYEYLNVPNGQYNMFMQAQSKGHYLKSSIIPTYESMKITL